MEPYKMHVTVRMADGRKATFRVTRRRTVMHIWKALGRDWVFDMEEA